MMRRLFIITSTTENRRVLARVVGNTRQDLTQYERLIKHPWHTSARTNPRVWVSRLAVRVGVK